MVVNLIMFLLIIGVLYVFAFPESHLAATTSAIGEIWSGSCRLSCLQSEYNGFSGLSGLNPGNSQDTKDSLVGRASYQSSNCVCATCPCALTENLLRTCRPATTMYSFAIKFMASAYYSVLALLLDSTDSASGTIYFGNQKDKDGFGKERDKPRRSDSAMPSSRSIVFRDISDTNENKQEQSSSKNAANDYTINNGVSNTTLTPNKDEETTNCTKCIEQGKVCMIHCPMAVKKKK